MKLGDVYKRGEIYYLVGSINELGGVCDDCGVYPMLKEDERVGNIKDIPDLINNF